MGCPVAVVTYIAGYTPLEASLDATLPEASLDATLPDISKAKHLVSLEIQTH